VQKSTQTGSICKTWNSEIGRRKPRRKTLRHDAGNDFLDRTPKTQEIKAKIGKWDYSNLCTAKETTERVKR
jgi:hypothetical protein